MRDALSLLGAGLLFSLLAWAIWHYLGSDAPGAIITIALVIASVDNARLRRQLRKKR